jgi:hypothetical protein
MARLARMVVPGVARHVTQRGNRRQQTFCEEDDYRAYLARLGEPAFLDRVERLLGRTLRPAKPGRKPRQREK